MQDIPVIETGVVPDIFVSGLADIEGIGGGCVRYSLYANDHGQRVIVAKLVMTVETLMAIRADAHRRFNLNALGLPNVRN